MEGQLVDARGVFPRPGDGDWIRLQWVEDPVGLDVSEAPARLDPRAAGKIGGKNVPITTEPLALNEAAVEKIERARGVQFPNIAYRVYPSFGAHDDVYSLGMVLFLCLLVNDSQDLGLVTDDLALMKLQAVDEGGWLGLVREQVASHPETWGTSAPLFDGPDRASGRPNAIPEELWIETLALALRMVAPSSDLAESEEDAPELFARVMEEVEGIVHRLRSLMFDRQPLNIEIQGVISEILRENHDG
jgi:hypothetical protein